LEGWEVGRSSNSTKKTVHQRPRSSKTSKGSTNGKRDENGGTGSEPFLVFASARRQKAKKQFGLKMREMGRKIEMHLVIRRGLGSGEHQSRL